MLNNSSAIQEWGMFLATILMAVFAGCSFATTRLLKASQEKLLSEQNKIQQKQLQLALLNEKQEIREDFRRLILSVRKNFEDVIYHCKTVTLDEFRTSMSKNLLTVMRGCDFFGVQFEKDVKQMIREFEKIISPDTDDLSKLRLFENGIEHIDRKKNISEADFDKYKKVHNNNISYLLTADQIFSDILETMTKNIGDVAKEFQPTPPPSKID